MITDENLNQKDIKEFLDKLNNTEIDDLHEHCVKEIKDSSLPIPEEIFEQLHVNKGEKTKKKKSLWEIFCSALGDDYEGHEEIWNSLSLEEKRDSISVALSMWADLMLLGLGSWFLNQDVPKSKKTAKDVFVKDKESFKFKPSFLQKGKTFLGAQKRLDNGTVDLFYKVPGQDGLERVMIPQEAFNIEDMPDIVTFDKDLINYIKEIPI